MANRSKDKGTAFETLIARHLNAVVDDRIERRALSGGADRGDIGGIRVHGKRLVGECKYSGNGYKVGPWLAEAEQERQNDDAIASVVFAKRRGFGKAEDQVVFMTVRDFVAILTGVRSD